MQSEYFEDHQDRRPGGSKQENSQDDHFLRPLTGRLDQVFAAEIRTAKIPFVTGETVPPTATRLKKAIRVGKFTLLKLASWFHEFSLQLGSFQPSFRSTRLIHQRASKERGRCDLVQTDLI